MSDPNSSCIECIRRLRVRSATNVFLDGRSSLLPTSVREYRRLRLRLGESVTRTEGPVAPGVHLGVPTTGKDAATSTSKLTLASRWTLCFEASGCIAVAGNKSGNAFTVYMGGSAVVSTGVNMLDKKVAE
jgi:hypothetical protein